MHAETRSAAAPPAGGALADSSGLSIDISQLPWTSPLAADYARSVARLAGFFTGNPGDPAAWRDAIANAQRGRDRTALTALLAAQLERRGAPAPAVAAATELADPRAVAVVTGQQAGLFGGPLFTLLKALSAIRLAADLRAEHGVPAVAVFWVDAEDHDWDEVKQCEILDAELAPRTVSLADPPGAGAGPVADVRLDASISDAVTALEAALTPTEFTPALVEELRRIYQPGTGMADAFARWLERLLGSRGLIVFDSSDPAAKPLVAHVFAQEVIDGGRTARLAAAAGAELTALGYHAQVSPQEGTLALFHLADGREGIRASGDAFLVGDRHVSRRDLEERVQQSPEEFSPNVLLRPIIQDCLFPTACYVAGPSELAYLAQLRGVYRAFGVPMPLVSPRASLTIIDSNAMRFLSRHDMPLAALRPQDDAALNALLEAQLPPSVEAATTAADRAIEAAMTALAREVPRVDATLEGAARSTLGRMQDDLKKLRNKIIQAAKRKDETLRRQYRHAQAQAFPGGEPQERAVSAVFFLNRYGPSLVDRLEAILPRDTGTHAVVTI